MKYTVKIVFTFAIISLFFGSAFIPTIHGSNVRNNIIYRWGLFQKKESSTIRGLDDKDFNETVNELLEIGHIPGLSACIIKNESVVWSDGFGYRDVKNKINATDDTVHPIASVTKLITATAIMQLYEQNKFELDDNVSEYLGFDLKNPNYPNINITFRMLLAHQSSLAGWTYEYFLNFMLLGYPRSWLKDYLIPGRILYNPNAWKNYAPGTDVFYSGINTELLGLLIEILSEQPYEEYVKENILVPLEMYNTSFYLSSFKPYILANQYIWLGFYFPIPHFVYGNHAAGGLYSTVLDLSHFLIAYIKNGTYKNYQLLEPETIDEMFTLQYPDSFDGVSRYGLGWYFWNNSDNVSFCGHGGIAVGGRAELRLRLDDNAGVIYCWNRDPLLYHIINSPSLSKDYKDSCKQLGSVFFDYADQLD